MAELSALHLSKFYGKKHVVKNVTFTMQSGDVTGLLGPNGAGKTTSFYMIVGFIKANGGSVMIDGHDITSLPMHKRSKMGLAYLPQEPSIFRKLSVENNIRLVLETQKNLSKADREEMLEKLIDDFGIQKVRKQYGYTLSGGERRRTEIARSLATSPKFLLLDEPFAGIDPKAVYEAIYQVTNHSATEFSATGMYSNEGRKMIYSVVSSTEAKVLIQKVMKADPHAFVNVVKTDILMGRFYQKENY